MVAAQWTEPGESFDLAVIRSCWDYQQSPDEFLAALAIWEAPCRLVNPVGTVHWNIDKCYLLELAALGISIPATVKVPAGDSSRLDEVLGDLGADRAVVKPLVGAGGIDTWLTGTEADQDRWTAGTGRGRLVQEYLPEIVTEGEYSLVHFRSGYSHAVIKRPAPGEFRVQDDHGGTVTRCDPGAELVAASTAILELIDHDWHYARVDVVLSGGGFKLMELELIEPDLFLRTAPQQLDRAAVAILAQAG